MLVAPARVLAQIQLVGFAGQAAVAKNPASASRSVLVNTGVAGIKATDGVVVVIGYLPGRAETREAGPTAVPATMIHLTPSTHPVDHATSQ
jgi:hypothetical protein